MVASDRVFIHGRIAHEANATAPGISGGCAYTAAADHSNSLTVSGVFVYSGLAGTYLSISVAGCPCLPLQSLGNAMCDDIGRSVIRIRYLPGVKQI
jgi:hypothetical protein